MVLQVLEKWRVNAFYPYEPALDRSVETGNLFSGTLEEMDITLPGDIYTTLEEYGVIEDPYLGLNSLACEWVKDRWWLYKNFFELSDEVKGKSLRLVLENINYAYSVTLNGRTIHRGKGAFIPAKIDITNDVRYDAPNVVVIVVEQAPQEMGQIGFTEQVQHHTSRYQYKWDFAPCMVNIGIHGEVRLEAYSAAAIEYLHVRPQLQEDGSCCVICQTELAGFKNEDLTVQYALYDGDAVVAEVATGASISQGNMVVSGSLYVEKPKLWWPNGYGEQPLYRLEVTITDSLGITEQRVQTVGIRSLQYEQCADSPADSLPYALRINGKSVYIKGANMVPLDMKIGSVTKQQVDRFLKLAKEANINLLRIWGGGVIESEYFYERCDELGLMIFQEFIQSSSGLNNIPSKNEEFIRELMVSATNSIKTRRNHVSLTYWCGGNELRKVGDQPADYTDDNVHLLHTLVTQLDPDRLFLPTCASGPEEFRHNNPCAAERLHDVHGPWKYDPDASYYRVYNEKSCQLHSEFGVDGVANLKTLYKVLPEAEQTAMHINYGKCWRHHGAWWNTMYRDTQLFGSFEDSTLEQFAKCSQFVQFEGLRYALYANRHCRPRNCGSIMWQFNEPWPNTSCTNVVDYYGDPKLGYYALQEAYRPLAASVRYEKLVWQPNETVVIKPFVCNDGNAVTGTLFISIADEKGKKLVKKQCQIMVPEAGTINVDDICFVTADRPYSCYTVEQLLVVDGESYPSRCWLFSCAEGEHISKEFVVDLYDEIIRDHTKG